MRSMSRDHIPDADHCGRIDVWFTSFSENCLARVRSLKYVMGMREQNNQKEPDDADYREACGEQ